MNPEDYTQNAIEEEGVFRAFPVAWTVEPSPKDDSQSVAIAFRFAIAQKWHGKEHGWSEQWPVGYFTENRTYVVKRDGTINQGAVDALAKCGLWEKSTFPQIHPQKTHHNSHLRRFREDSLFRNRRLREVNKEENVETHLLQLQSHFPVSQKMTYSQAHHRST